MYRIFTLLLGISTCAFSLLAHDEAAEEAVRARAIAELTTANKIVTDHESGRKKASDDALAAARDVLRKHEERRAELERNLPLPPILITALRDTKYDLARICDAANREFMRSTVARLREIVEHNDPVRTGRIAAELAAAEKHLASLKDTGKPFGGCEYVTIFEERDTFVVSYYASDTWDQFVCVLNKSDYSPRPRAEAERRQSVNATQLKLIVQ